MHKIFIVVGAGIICIAEVLLFSKVRPVAIFFTPIVWTGYILLIDGIIYSIRKESLIISRTKEFILMLFLSLIFWIIFEFYNLYIENWFYINLIRSKPLLIFGCSWAWMTIMPGLFETAELLESLKFLDVKIKRFKMNKIFLNALLICGFFLLLLPLFVPKTYAKWLAIPVWTGFIFFCDPINYKFGGKSLLGDFEGGRAGKFLSLFVGGLICGFLWEFWNHWAYTKWIYGFPYWTYPKLFEMPLLGYLGFPALTLEYYAMYNSTKLLLNTER